MKRFISGLCAAMLLASSLFLINNPAGAQGSNGYIISPVREELTIEQGSSQTVTLYVQNVTGGKLTGQLVANDYLASETEDGQPRLLLDNSEPSPSNSFKTLVGDLPTIVLDKGEKKEISVKISVPKNASAGGYYGVIRVENVGSASENNVGLTASVGTVFLIKVPGELKEALDLVEFTAAKNDSTGRFFLNSGEISVVTRLRNTGTIHVKPFGKVIITDRTGKTIETYEFNDKEPRSNILPTSTRKFSDKLKNQKWFGQYKVTANLGYGTSGGLITTSATFWVIPSWLMILAGAVLLVLLVLGYLLYRRIKTGRTHHRSARR